MSDLFPIFLDLRGKKALIVGLGAVALRKAKVLSQAGAEVRALGLRLKEPSLQQYAEVEVRPYQNSDVRGVFIACAATDDPIFNQNLCSEWNAIPIIANNATSKEAENAYFVHHRTIKGCQVAVSGKGRPSLAKDILDSIEVIL